MSEGVEIRPLPAEDLPAAAAIFADGFRESVERVYGRPPKLTAILDVWRFCRSFEPAGFLGAYEATAGLLGYAIFTTSLGRLQRATILSGRPLVWAFRAVAGEYGIVWKNVLGLLCGKLSFLGSARKFRTQGDAQLVNIAVARLAQGRGVAKALIHAGSAYLRGVGVPEVRLEVRPDNEAAIKVYLDCGFAEAGRTRDAHGEWLVMTARPDRG